jgi:hypothetical protein
MAKHASIDDYLADLPPQLRTPAERVRRLVDSELSDSTSAIKWAQPVWSVGGEPVCYLKKASRHVTFGFWRGASFDDPSGSLETSGEVMAHVKIRSEADVDEKLFADWLRQARALADGAR